MALIWCDGFTGYGTTNHDDPSPSGIIEAKYRGFVANESRQKVLVDGGRITGDCLEFDYKGFYEFYLRSESMTSNNTMIAGIAYYVDGDINGTNDNRWPILSFKNGNDANVDLFLGLQRSIVVQDGNLNVFSVAPVHLAEYDWCYIEMKVYHHSSNGTIEVRINSCPVLELSSINTVPTGDISDRCGIGNNTDRYDNKNARICDFYVCDGSGSKNNDFLGPVTVDTLFPDGDDTTEFETTGNGNYATHYEQVNGKDALWDDDYIEDGTTGNQDIFTYQNAQNFASIHGVIGWTTSNYVSTSNTYKMLCESDNSTLTSSNITPGSAFQTDKFVVEDDPASSFAWTPRTINSIKFGLEIQ